MKTKIALSPEEMDLVQNADLILTKNRIMQKAWLLLEGLQESLVEHVSLTPNSLPSEILTTPAKISKGENYQGLPYLVLDYPRHFEKENIFTIRNMFWWGNFFSITIQLSGMYLKRFAEKISASYCYFSDNDYFINASDSEWEHHFEPTNYIRVNTLTENEFRDRLSSSFIKIAKKIDLGEWENAPALLQDNFTGLVKLLD